jgi:hypothetical protein
MGATSNEAGRAKAQRVIDRLADALSLSVNEDGCDDKAVGIALLITIGNWVAVEERPLLRQQLAWAITQAVEAAADKGDDGWMAEVAARNPKWWVSDMAEPLTITAMRAEIEEQVARLRHFYPEASDSELRRRAGSMREKRYREGHWLHDLELAALVEHWRAEKQYDEARGIVVWFPGDTLV